MEWREEWEEGRISEDEYSATSLGKVCCGPADTLMNSLLGFAAWQGSLKKPCFFTDCLQMWRLENLMGAIGK